MDCRRSYEDNRKFALKLKQNTGGVKKKCTLRKSSDNQVNEKKTKKGQRTIDEFAKCKKKTESEKIVEHHWPTIEEIRELKKTYKYFP